MNRLKDEDIIPLARRTPFLKQVFWNVHDIIAVNTRLRDALTKRQKSYAVVDRIGDVLLEAVPHFGPFVSYGAHQLYGKYEFEKEKNTNPAFVQFVDVLMLSLAHIFTLIIRSLDHRTPSRISKTRIERLSNETDDAISQVPSFVRSCIEAYTR